MKSIKNALGMGTAATVNTANTAANVATGNTALNAPVTGYSNMSAVAPGFGEVKEGETVLRSAEPTFGATSFAQQSFAPSVATIQTTSTEFIQPAIQKQVIAPIIQHREVAPVIHERFRREEVEEIQPIIHREREKTEIHKITQPICTSSVLGVVAEEGMLPAQSRPEIRTPGMLAPSIPLGTRESLAGQRLRVEKPALIVETEKRNVIEEIQPVVYREIVEPHVIKLTQPIYERIVEGDVYISQTLPTQISSAWGQETCFSTLAQQSFAQQGLTNQQFGLGQQGFGAQQFGASNLGQQGFYDQGLANQQFANQGFANQGLANQGLANQQFANQQFANQGLANQQFANQGLANQQFANQGLANQGFANQGLYDQGLGGQQWGASNLGQQGLYGQQGLAQQGLGTSNLGQQGLAQQGLMGQQGLGQQGFTNTLNQGLANQTQGMINQGLNAISPTSFMGKGAAPTSALQGASTVGRTTSTLGSVGTSSLA